MAASFRKSQDAVAKISGLQYLALCVPPENTVDHLTLRPVSAAITHIRETSDIL